MKKYLLLLLALAFTAKAQDTIVLNSHEKLVSQVLQIEEDSIRYKLLEPPGPDLSMGSLDVLLVKYKNGSVVNVDSLYKAQHGSVYKYVGPCAVVGTPTQLYEKGRTDANKNFKSNCGSYFLAGLGLAFGPLAAAPAFIVMAIPPVEYKMNYPCEELWQNKDYKAGYKKRTRQIKGRLIWERSIPCIAAATVVWSVLSSYGN